MSASITSHTFPSSTMSSKMDLVRFAILINNFISDIEGLNLSVRFDAKWALLHIYLEAAGRGSGGGCGGGGGEGGTVVHTSTY